MRRPPAPGSVTSSSFALGASPAAYVTALPASPVDGQEIYYAADATNGVIWYLRYRAASSSSYKWEVVGGTSLNVFIVTVESRASTTFGDLATVGPSITVPLAGDYNLSVSCLPTPSGSTDIAIMGYDLGATSATTARAARASGTANSVAFDTSHAGVAASTLIRAKYRNVTGTAFFENRWLEVMPVRVG